ncbi:unnamed protein product [Miscanthus lutarioriparius]|uniref:Uncharacterized protein n=1 Tax=Miscanthus lutarioriparius TaxID=422564 RepID=A0A811N6E3_9POAL|nr:unnamed protein product [Miscanthus lutarioriparius]
MALPAQVPLVRLPRLSWQPVQVHVGVDEVVEGVIVAAVRSAALCRSRDLALDRRRRGERRWPDLLGGPRVKEDGYELNGVRICIRDVHRRLAACFTWRLEDDVWSQILYGPTSSDRR